MADRREFAIVAQERAAGWRRMAFLICGDWTQAEDLVQVVLIRLFQRWHRIDEHGVDAYARKAITRLAIDQARRPHRRHEVASEQVPDRPGRAVDRDAALDVRDALASVPARQRATLVLRFYSGLTVSETASALGVSEGTVKSQTARGLATLRAALHLEAALPTVIQEIDR